MTNWIAFALVVLFAGFLALDHYVLGLGAGLFLARRAVDLIGYLAFWR